MTKDIDEKTLAEILESSSPFSNVTLKLGGVNNSSHFGQCSVIGIEAFSETRKEPRRYSFMFKKSDDLDESVVAIALRQLIGAMILQDASAESEENHP